MIYVPLIQSSLFLMVCEGANAGECGFWPEPQSDWKWDWIPRCYGHFTFEVRKMAPEGGVKIKKWGCRRMEILHA